MAISIASAGLFVLSIAGPARAGEPGSATEQKDLRTVLFGSLDASRSGFGGVGFKRTLLDSLDRSGPAVLGSVGYGARFERDVSNPYEPEAIRHTAHGSAMIGYQRVTGWGVIAGFVGPEVDFERLAGSYPSAHDSRPRWGARLHGEVWAHPTANTLLTATVIVGSARGELWSRLSWGYRIWRDLFIGPEATAYARDTDRDWQLGLHATGLAFGRFTLRLSGGWRWEDEGRRKGPYVGVTGYVRM
jgi:hypothetical protein